MRKKVFGRKLKRDTNERKALFKSLMISLVLEGKIKTTRAKAKSINSEIEKLVTKAKNNGEQSRSLLVSRLGNTRAVEKIISEIAPKFSTRPGGYTRILKLGTRVKDNSDYVLVSWVEEVSKTSSSTTKRNKLAKETKKVSKEAGKEVVKAPKKTTSKKKEGKK